MPDPAIDHEGYTPTQAAALAFLTQECESTQAADDKGKAIVEDDADESGVVYTSSSSSSSEEIKQDFSTNSLLKPRRIPREENSRSLQLDDSLIDKLGPLSLNPTGKERLAIVPSEANAQIIVLASHESDQPGAVGRNPDIATSAANKGKRKAEEAKDEAEAPPKVTKVMSETEAFWHNHVLRPFRDLPDQASTSSGLGQHRCMQLMGLPEEPPHEADPTGLQEQVYEPEQISSPELLTFRILTFGIDYVSQDGPVLISFLDELQVEDHEELGVEGFLHQDHGMDED